MGFPPPRNVEVATAATVSMRIQLKSSSMHSFHANLVSDINWGSTKRGRIWVWNVLARPKVQMVSVPCTAISSSQLNYLDLWAATSMEDLNVPFSQFITLWQFTKYWYELATKIWSGELERSICHHIATAFDCLTDLVKPAKLSFIVQDCMQSPKMCNSTGHLWHFASNLWLHSILGAT